MYIFKVKRPISRKEYVCGATAIIRGFGYGIEDCETEEQKEIFRTAEKEGFVIVKGTEYVCRHILDEGKFYVYRARPDMDNLCIELGCFDLV